MNSFGNNCRLGLPPPTMTTLLKTPLEPSGHHILVPEVKELSIVDSLQEPPDWPRDFILVGLAPNKKSDEVSILAVTSFH